MSDLFEMVFNVEAPSSPTEVVPQIEYQSDIEFNIELVKVGVTDDVALAEFLVTLNGESWLVSGSSKRLRGDKPDRHTGLSLAIGRAIERLGKQLLRQANGRVQHNDHNAQERKARAAAAVKAAAKAKPKAKKK